MTQTIAPAAEELWINNNLTVADLATEEECTDAFQYLTGQIVSIEAQMADYLNGETDLDSGWYKRAKGALRYKKAALNLIQQRRGELGRAAKAAAQKAREERFENYFIQAVKAAAPDVFDLACAEAIRRLRDAAA